MRVERWRAKEIFGQITEQAILAATEIMDEVVEGAKARCPVGTVTREGKYVMAKVTISTSFTPSRGRNTGVTRNRTVSFDAKRWTGRSPGNLKSTIRRVTRPSRPGNIRVYAGNHKYYWAHMVEYGTVKMNAQPFLRPPFQQIKSDYKSKIENGIARVPEVKR